jgi:hypothetical protein
MDLEILFSARNGPEHAKLERARTGFLYLETTDAILRRAKEMQGLLARKGQHRATSVPDLSICAVAEHHSATVLFPPLGEEPEAGGGAPDRLAHAATSDGPPYASRNCSSRVEPAGSCSLCSAKGRAFSLDTGASTLARARAGRPGFAEGFAGSVIFFRSATQSLELLLRPR